ncbi:MAG: hypothetical protein ACHQRM_01080 [Bacteroidia bacterium]
METNPELNGNSLKAKINGSADLNKETLRKLVETNHRLIQEAMESNKKLVDSIKEKLKEQSVSGTLAEPLKENFQKTISVSEDALDGIINSYSRQMKQNMDFNSQIIDAIQDVRTLDTEKILELVKDNFEKSNQLTIQSTKDVMDCYRRHIALASKFNERFADSIRAQIDAMFNFQRMSTKGFSELASKVMKQHLKN